MKTKNDAITLIVSRTLCASLVTFLVTMPVTNAARPAKHATRTVSRAQITTLLNATDKFLNDTNYCHASKLLGDAGAEANAELQRAKTRLAIAEGGVLPSDDEAADPYQPTKSCQERQKSAAEQLAVNLRDASKTKEQRVAAKDFYSQAIATIEAVLGDNWDEQYANLQKSAAALRFEFQ